MYAQANLEIPQWGTMLGIDPRTKEEVWDPLVSEDGRQQSIVYSRGDVVDQSKFRQSDWDALVAQGALGEGVPPDDTSPGAPVPPDAVHVIAGEGGTTVEGAVPPVS